jgi:hypothetical protein
MKEEARLRVFQNIILRNTYGSEIQKATGDWRRVSNGEHYNLHPSPHVARVIKSRRVRTTGHEQIMGRREVHAECWWGNLKGRV